MSFLDFLDDCQEKKIRFSLVNKQLKINAPENTLKPVVIEKIREFKPSLMEWLQSEQFIVTSNKLSDFVTVVPINRDRKLESSLGQEQLWLTNKLDTMCDGYHFSRVLEFSGRLNVEALNASFNAIIERHEPLRTVYFEGNGMLYQKVLPVSQFTIPFIDLSHLEIQGKAASIALLHQEFVEKTFDLSADIMMRLQIIRVEEEVTQLVIVLHHIASDGWSLGILFSELQTLYNQLVQLDNPKQAGLASLSTLPVQYVDYSAWQRKNELEGINSASLEYWMDSLAGVPEIHCLPTVNARPQVQSFKAGHLYRKFDTKMTQALKNLALSSGTTLFIVLETLFAAIISRYSGSNDVVVGTVVANRSQENIEGLIGYFANMLPLRHKIDLNMSFQQLIVKATKEIVSALEHQHTPFAKIVRELNQPRDRSYNPLIQIAFVLQNNEFPDLSLSDVSCSIYHPKKVNTIFDLNLEAVELAGELELRWEYAADLFDESNISQMAIHFERLVTGVLNNPSLPLQQMELLNQEERHQQLVVWNPIRLDFSKELCVHELFEVQVKKNPDAIAVIYEESQLSYADLNQQANQLAYYLIEEKQIKPDTLVGLCVERSIEMVIGILAILKAGGAYVPLDPNYPKARLDYMLEDANLGTVLIQKHLRDRTLVNARQAVYLDSPEFLAHLNTLPAENIEPERLGLQPDNLAYVIYTSGSTGKPKGVLIEHQNVVRLFDACREGFSFGSNDVWTLFHSFAFDFSVWEIWGALFNGGRLVVVPHKITKSPEDFYKLIERENITVLSQTPGAFSQFVAIAISQSAITSLRYVVFGGEALNFASLKSWVAQFGDSAPQLINMYGITETTVHVTFKRVMIDDIEKAKDASLIGRPLSDLAVLVLSQELNLLPVSVVGEMYVGGTCVARGYLNRPELTAERFIANPFYDANDPQSCQRLYKTGDLARLLLDGSLEYLGRVDSQVKIRGFRIELGEIEHILVSHPLVNDAVVLAKKIDSGDKRLEAYVAADNMTTMAAGDNKSMLLRHDFIESLRQVLSKNLPEYMLPSAFVLLERLPLTANGKVDHNDLPEPDLSIQQTLYVAPTNDTEKTLCDIWQEILDLERVGVTDNFFELGGHSLLATRLVAQINEIFNLDLAINTLFTHQTIQGLVHELSKLEKKERRTALVQVARDEPFPLSFAQQRLWLLDQIDADSSHYNMPGEFRLSGDLNYSALDFVFSSIVERHQSLRTCFLEGDDGQPIQVIQDTEVFNIPRLDLSALNVEAQGKELARCVEQAANKTFDLSRDLMLRAQLLKFSVNEHVLLVTMHHIASDGWSLGIFVREFQTLYNHYGQVKSGTLPPLPIQYVDYSAWQRKTELDATNSLSLEYWKDYLAGAPEIHSLTTDFLRPKVQSFKAGHLYRMFDVKMTQALKTLVRNSGTTLFVVLESLFAAIISRYSGNDDVVIGTAVANRSHKNIEGLIGYFVNMLPLRHHIDPNLSFQQFLEKANKEVVSTFEHQHIPFSKIVREAIPTLSSSINPLIQITFILQSNDVPDLSLNDINCQFKQTENTKTNFDLKLEVTESDNVLELHWEYAVELFNESSISQLARHFERLVTSVLNNDTMPMNQLEILNFEERHQQLVELNASRLDYPKDLSIHELFEVQVKKNPDAIAVVFEKSQMTYSELNHRSNRLAHYLIEEKQVKPDALIGLCVERSPEMVIGILAILKAGGAYVPLDPNYPEARLSYMLDDARLTTVLTQRHLRGRTPMSDTQAVYLDDEAFLQQLSDYSTENIDPAKLSLKPHHLAYVIYTSGSTGQPKGVCIAHRSWQAYSSSILQNYQLVSTDKVLQFSSISFDIFVEEFTASLLNGGTLVLPAFVHVPSTSEFWQLIKTREVTVATLPTAYWHQLCVDESLSRPIELNQLRLIIVGGEAISTIHLQRWQQQVGAKVKLLNTYGPTESTVISSRFDATEYRLNGRMVPIGKATADSNLIILDKYQSLVPQGVAAELHIGGPCLSLGYLNRPELTAEKFVANPFYAPNDPQSSERLYKTGDLVRWLPDGNLEFLGRIDHQVKIRGFRIELGEIEQRLLSEDAVNDAVVLAKESDSGDKRLVAYVTTDSAAAMAGEDETSQALRHDFIESLRQSLKQDLPEYMLPSAFVLLAHLPLTPNGKVDRKALPEPDMSLQQTKYIAPTTETEQVLCEIWQELLGLERVGISDNFFELGGHSLLATRLIAIVNQRFDLALTLQTIFSQFTVQGLTQLIDEFIKVKKLSSGELNVETLTEEELDRYLELMQEV